MSATLVFCEEALSEADGQPPRGRPGVSRLVEEAYAAGWRFVAVSVSPYATVESALEHAVGSDRAKDFTVFAGNPLVAPKPAPDIYHLAMSELGLAAADVIAVEGTPEGVAASAAAGIRTVFVAGVERTASAYDEAALVVSSLGDDDTECTVLHDPLGLQLVDRVTIQDLSRILATPRS